MQGDGTTVSILLVGLKRCANMTYLVTKLLREEWNCRTLIPQTAVLPFHTPKVLKVGTVIGSSGTISLVMAE